VKSSEDRKIASHIFQGFWTGFVLPPLLNGGEGSGGRRNVRRSRHGSRDYVASGGGRANFAVHFCSCHLTEIPSPIPKPLQNLVQNNYPNPSRRLAIGIPYYPSHIQYTKSHHKSPSLIKSTPPNQLPKSTGHPSVRKSTLPVCPRWSFPSESKTWTNGSRQSVTSQFSVSITLATLLHGYYSFVVVAGLLVATSCAHHRIPAQSRNGAFVYGGLMATTLFGSSIYNAKLVSHICDSPVPSILSHNATPPSIKPFGQFLSMACMQHRDDGHFRRSSGNDVASDTSTRQLGATCTHPHANRRRVSHSSLALYRRRRSQPLTTPTHPRCGLLIKCKTSPRVGCRRRQRIQLPLEEQ